MPTIRTIGIRGAGLSGLSVAQELLRADPNISISIFDIRPRNPHPPRTFCFFDDGDVDCRAARFYDWKAVLFRGSSFERRLDVSHIPYTMIRGDDFFSSALEELEARGVSFRFGCQQVVAMESSLLVDGELLSFDRVVDSAFDPKLAMSLMWQSFAGAWVTTETPLFDPSTATLMDLQESSSEAPVSFLYVLPVSKHSALVEHTTFSPEPLPREYHFSRAFDWLRARVEDTFQVGECEHGAIPMGLEVEPVGRGYLVGSNAGAVRPATGYAFVAARAHARRVAQSLLGDGGQPERAYPHWLEKADLLFLHALRRAPHRGGALMERLLARSRGESLISFLSGSVGFKDALSVWLSVPKTTMIRSLLRV